MILCLGEAIVDLVCERELDSPGEADEFRARFGGALANVAVSAARQGASPALGGGVGDDPFGRWLCERLSSEGVSLDFFSYVKGVRTPIAVITFDRDREPDFQVYDEGIARTVCSIEPRLDEAVGGCEALVFGSNTLVGERERAMTLRARELALSRGTPILFDPNLRAHRWDELDLARELCLEAARGCFCVRANEEEGRWLTGEVDPGAAAEKLAAIGGAIGVVTLGSEGAVARGQADADVDGIDVEVISPLGAGDAFMGALTAAYAKAGWDPAETAAALAAANRAGAEACAVWRAVP